MFVLKFLPAKYLDSFLDGNLYMNTLEHFVSLEADIVRGDSAEGMSTLRQFKEIAIQDPKTMEYVPIGGVLPGLLWRDPGIWGINVFCMYE